MTPQRGTILYISVLVCPLHGGVVLEDSCRLLGSHMLQAEHVVDDALHVTADGGGNAGAASGTLKPPHPILSQMSGLSGTP